jgi:hypothetical protein
MVPTSLRRRFEFEVSTKGSKISRALCLQESNSSSTGPEKTSDEIWQLQNEIKVPHCRSPNSLRSFSLLPLSP